MTEPQFQPTAKSTEDTTMSKESQNKVEMIPPFGSARDLSRSRDATGYLNIFHRDGEFHIEMHVGAQSFGFEYSNEDYDSVAWYANQT